MNIASLHTGEKTVGAKSLFSATNGQVMAIKILQGHRLKEHTTPIPAMLVCVIGETMYEDEKGKSVVLLPGDYLPIEPEVIHWLNARQDSQLLLIK